MGTPQKSIGNHLVLWPIKLYYNYTKEPQNSIGNYLGTYSKFKAYPGVSVQAGGDLGEHPVSSPNP